MVFALLVLEVYRSFVQSDIERIRDFADQATERMLTAMNEQNYTEFSESFAPRVFFDQVCFASFNSLVTARFGRYVSKEFLNVTRVGGYEVWVVYYRAKFTNETGYVTVSVSMTEFQDKLMVTTMGIAKEPTLIMMSPYDLH